MSAKRFKLGSELRADIDFAEEVQGLESNVQGPSEIEDFCIIHGAENGRVLVPRPQAGGAMFGAPPVD
ncbi:MAG: hypothetical protein NT154_06615 [Verrucomicrobia bacterium]|nr:hypothetical protein [Verrucomicrobiota bacterium]